MPVVENDVQVVQRVVGNQEAIGAQLKDIDGANIDITGLTMKFRMVNTEDGTVKVNDASATISVGTDGKVSYAPAAADVDTAGEFAMYFQDSSSPIRRWPPEGARFKLVIVAEQNDS